MLDVKEQKKIEMIFFNHLLPAQSAGSIGDVKGAQLAERLSCH
jgi:hypothetical protein